MTAALALTIAGVPCRIVDRRANPAGSSRALGLQARSMEVLAGMGVTDRIESSSYRLRGSSMMRGRRTLAHLDWIPPESRFPHTYVLPQAGLEAILRDRLDDLGVRIEHGVEVAHVRTLADSAYANVCDGASIQAPWIVGADGSRSTVRRSLAIDFPERSTGETYYLADVHLDTGIELADGAMWLGPQGPLMLMRLPGDGSLFRVFVDITDRPGGSDPAALDEAALTAILEDRGPGCISVRSLCWTSIFRTRIALADSYGRDRVLLAGDAAHVFPPFGGQGMNLGIQDATNLAWRIAAATPTADSRVAKAYERERRPVAQTVMADVEARRRMFALRHPIARATRDVLLTLGGRSVRAARRASMQNSQLAISYRDHTPGGNSGPAPRPGDRAPHASIDGTSLHEIFGPGHATLLLFGQAVEWRLPTTQVRIVRITTSEDRDSAVRRRYGAAGDDPHWVLVRPDGHVAARGCAIAQARPYLAGSKSIEAAAGVPSPHDYDPLSSAD
jgi:4,5-epoxidase